MKNKLNLAVLQRVCTNYRVPLFTKLSENQEVNFKLFIGEDLPNSKVKNYNILDSVNHIKLKTRFLRIFKWVLPYHINLIQELRRFNADVIICEAESHFIGYLMALIYKKYFNKKVSLIYWCYINIPGKEDVPFKLSTHIKKYFRKKFDAFLLYSNFGVTKLLEQGIPKERIFTSVNVGDVDKFLEMSDSIYQSKSLIRDKLVLPNKFTVLYVGTLDKNKNPEILLNLASILDSSIFSFILLGSGEMEFELNNRIEKEGLNNVYLLGKKYKELPLYYKASDILVIPGRGGIVISEAMSFQLPVIIYQGDGTELDLVTSETGIILSSNEVESFKNAILKAYANKQEFKKKGIKGQELIRNKYNTGNMVEQMLLASKYVYNKNQF